MPKPSPKELGGRVPLSLRAGVDIPRWNGVNRQDDPGGIGDAEFQRLINIRHKGAKLIERPGLTKLHTTALDGVVRGLYDPLLNGGHGDSALQEVLSPTSCTTTTGYGTGGSRLWIVGIDVCNGTQGCIYHYAKDQNPKVQKAALTGVHDYNAGLHVTDSDFMWLTTGTYSASADTVTYSLQKITPGFSNYPPLQTFAFTQSLTNDAGSSGYPGNAGAASFMGKWYFSSNVNNSSGDSIVRVWSFDGRTLTTEDSNTITGGNSVSYGSSPTKYNEELIVPHTYGAYSALTDIAFPTLIRKRTAAGTWSTLSMPANVTKFGAQIGRCVVYKGKLYIFGFGVKTDVHATNRGGIVLSYDGSALAVEQTTIVAGSQGYHQSFRSPVLFNGYIYYLHSASGATTTQYVGRFDGSSWDNTHKQITVDYPITALTDIAWLEAFQGDLVIGGIINNGTCKIMASPGTSTGGTWTAVYTGDTNNRFMSAETHVDGGGGFGVAVL